MTTLAIPSGAELARLGERRTWVRDLAIIGGVSGALAPAAVGMLFPGYVLLAGAFGAGSGAVVGHLASAMLGKERIRRVPVAVLLVGGLGLGALWGALTGLGAALGLGAFSAPGSGAVLLVLSALLASVAGAIQLGWFWLPYAILRARGRRTWPLVVVASLLAPALGWAALAAFALVSGH